MKITLDTETKKIHISASISFTDTLRVLEAIKAMGENPDDWKIGPEEVRMGWIQGMQDNWQDQGGFISPYTYQNPDYHVRGGGNMYTNEYTPITSGYVDAGLLNAPPISALTYWGLDNFGQPVYRTGDQASQVLSVNGLTGHVNLEI